MTSNESILRPRLGSSGLEAGAAGLGCMTWAYGVDDRDEARSITVIHPHSSSASRSSTPRTCTGRSPTRSSWAGRSPAGATRPCWRRRSGSWHHEWAYTAFTRARGQTRFYICEPDPSRGFSHKALRSLRAGILLPCYL